MYLYHYFDKRSGPFRSLTALPEKEASSLFINIRDDRSDYFGALRSDDYLSKRRKSEEENKRRAEHIKEEERRREEERLRNMRRPEHGMPFPPPPMYGQEQPGEQLEPREPEDEEKDQNGGDDTGVE